jgi:signal transduction histidine kinase
MPLTIERKLPLILFFVVVVLTALGFAFYQYTTSSQDAMDLEKRAHNVAARLDETLRLTLDIEGSVNGFVITGNDTYLEPYQRAKVRLPGAISELRSAVDKDPVQTEELGRLEGWTTDYVAQAERKIERRKMDGFEATIASLSDPPARVLTANIRASIDRLKASALRTLERQDQALEESFFRTIWVLIIGCVAGMIALGFANVIVSREIGKRRKAETALIDANRDLETRIDERTVELEMVNESLRRAADERETLLTNEKSARREAEIANRLRDEFMATVSHELKTPLNSILGWARMLKGGQLDDAQVKRALGTIIKNSETQNRLIEDLMDVARIISGKLVLEIEPIDLVELLGDTVEIVQPAAKAKSISIENRTETLNGDLLVNGDRDRLRQVFSNLLTNAVKFTPADGQVEICLDRDDETFHVRVKDNGIGISPDFLPVVFERFRQDTSAAPRNGGIGLGLAIVRQLVEMHGGSVAVTSEGPGEGSEFTVTLPALPREDPRQEPQA